MAVEIRAATYADLRTALAAGTYQAGQMVFCEGRAADGDGGQGMGQVVAIGSLTDDGGVTLTGGSFAWRRVNSGAVDVRWFGAVGDGVTDDAAAIQAALDYAEGVVLSDKTTQALAVYFPPTPDYYRVATTLEVGAGVSIIGAGHGSGVIADSGNVFDLGNSRDQSVSDIRIETTGAGSIGIKADVVFRLRVSGVRIDGADYGIRGSKTLYIDIDNVLINAGVTGISFYGDSGTWNNAEGWYNNLISMRQVKCFGDSTTTTGISVVGMGVYMENCDTSRNLVGTRIAGTDTTAINRAKTATILNHYNESTDKCFELVDVTSCVILGNYAQGAASGSAKTVCYDLDNSKVFAAGNTFIDYFEHIVVGANASIINWPAAFQYFVDTAFSSLSGSSIAQVFTSGAAINPGLSFTDIPLGASSSSATSHAKAFDNGATSVIFEARQNNGTARHRWRVGGASNWNSADAAYYVGRDSTSSRSINAAGTINASGADYAEYEKNNGLRIQKGQIVGFKDDGSLTLKFSEAVRFGVKSTNPAYVGGDSWGSGLEGDELEAARARVDRIAYCGKVPVLVYGARPGDYIVAAPGPDGTIVAKPMPSPGLSDYLMAVGRAVRILDSAAAEIAIIVH